MNSPREDIHSEEFLHKMMHRQRTLAIWCAVAFCVGLLGLPLLNYFLPEIMAREVFGFSLTWLIIGILFFPYVWIISWIFNRRSIAMEEKISKDHAD